MIEQLIEDLKNTLDTLSKDGDEFSGAIDRLDKLVKGCPLPTATRSARRSSHSTTARRRWPTCSDEARSPLAGTVGPAEPAGAALDNDKDRLNVALERAPEDLPEAFASRRLRQLLPVLHLRNHIPRKRPSGPHRRVPVGHAGNRKVCGALMDKYGGSKLVRAGIIGVVLAILVIAIGLQPERLVQWATSIRYQALFSEAGGLTAGNDVTGSGIKVGSGGPDLTAER